MLVHRLGEREDARLRRQGDRHPEGGEGECPPHPGQPPDDGRDERDREQAAPGLHVEPGSRPGVVQPIDDQGVRPQEQAEIVEQSRPLRAEVDQRRHVGLPRRLEDRGRQQPQPIGDPCDHHRRQSGQRTPGKSRSSALSPVEKQVHHDRERQGDGDRLGEHGGGCQQAGNPPSAADRCVEGAEVARGGQEGRSGRDVVHRLGVERVYRHQERGCDGHRHGLAGAEPEVVPNDAKHQQADEPVQDQVDEVVAPGGEPGHLVVQGERQDEEGA